MQRGLQAPRREQNMGPGQNLSTADNEVNKNWHQTGTINHMQREPASRDEFARGLFADLLIFKPLLST